MKYRVIIFLCFGIFVMFLLNGCGSMESSKSTEELRNELSALSGQLMQLQMSIEDRESADIACETIVISEENITTNIIEVEGSSIVASIINNSDYTYTGLFPTIIFYDSNDNIVSYSSLYLWNVYPDITYMTSSWIPMDNDNIPIEYDHYEIIYTGTVAAKELINYADKIEVTSNVGARNNIIVKLKNQADVTISSIGAYAIYYRKDEMVGVVELPSGEIPKGGFTVATFDVPYDNMTYLPVEYDNYKIVVTYALTEQVTMQF